MRNAAAEDSVEARWWGGGGVGGQLLTGCRASGQKQQWVEQSHREREREREVGGGPRLSVFIPQTAES